VLIVAVPGVVLLAVGGAAPLSVACLFAAVSAAAAWPWTDRVRRRRELDAVACSGIESLLELSIALFAAGATPHEVASIASRHAGGDLRVALEPAVHRLALGRSLPSAFGDLPVISASPHLDAWLHAICASAELGAPATQVLHQLLVDARAIRRERIRAVAATAAPRMQLALVLLVVPGIMWIMLVTTVGGLVEQLRSFGVA
jgi:Flp pilus assembly protein TadB